MLEKTYDISAIEQNIDDLWRETDSFKAYDCPEEADKAFCIMLPPPNLTGSLHMGHALDITVQDILARFMRMHGKNVLWQPGLDHAGIATQMVVERHLQQQGQPNRVALGREAFVERIWDWCREYGGVISSQMRRLGASCDWSRERFTLDEGLSKAVTEVFVTLYKEGLIYKDKRLVNWDVKLLTAISDVEVIPKEVKSHLYYINYKLVESGDYVTIATTRPETIFGDVALAVHPDDPRYKMLVGQEAVVPLVGRKIKVIEDSYVDMNAGSGVLKITPAHDFNDFELGRRHKLEIINVLNANGSLKLSELADIDLAIKQRFDNLDRFKARRNLVDLLEESGLLEKVEAHTHMVPHGDRSGEVVEPFLTEQWYVDASVLSKAALQAIKNDEIEIIPASWKKTYFKWLENIQPWCISRQLWWGHQIPAWYGPDNKIFVEKTESEAKVAAYKYYGEEVKLRRDEDVLDTWFSSGLWPFSTLGWPENTDAFKTFYPTSYLVTGFDLLFFWVARMIMLGLHFTGRVPFKKVYFHALVRDKTGAKMSKTKGNVINPLELIDEYGADALRFFLATMLTPQGRDIKLDPSRIAGYRNFVTKLWNATRFAQLNDVVFSDIMDLKIDSKVNQWILHELTLLQLHIEKSVEQNMFHEAANALYKFIWSYFCDWYIEFTKSIFALEEGTHEKKETQYCMGYCLTQIYKMLHPFMPYITEYLWQQTSKEPKATSLAKTQWQRLAYMNDDIASGINFVISFISEIRSVRMQMGVAPGAFIPLTIVKIDGSKINYIRENESIIAKLARVEKIQEATVKPAKSVQILVEGVVAYLELSEFIDIPKEKERLDKELAKIATELRKLDSKLTNEKFLANANKEVIEKDKIRQKELLFNQEKIAAALQDLQS